MEDTSMYDMFINVLLPKNEFNSKVCKVHNLTFDQIEVIKKIFNAPTMDDIKDLFQTCYNISGSMKQSADDEYYNTNIFDLFRAQRFLQEYMNQLIKRESNQLSGTPDDKMLMINAYERLKPYSHHLTKIKLAEQFSTTPTEIGRWKYRDVFSILVANRVNADITKEYQQIK